MPSDAAGVPDRRMLLVHAHPDDETIASGATMAKYVSEGAGVTLITCTSGEEGEVLVDELAHLAVARGDRLGPHRVQELAEAMKILGVRDHRFLGGPGRYRDSGMMGEPSNVRPDSFWQADLLEASADLVQVIREVCPAVLVTYDDFGGYGHPDHIQAHRVATYATSLAAVPSYRPELGAAWDVPKVYWACIPKSFIREGLAAMVSAGGSGFFGIESADDIPWAVEDSLVTARIDGRAFEAPKLAALRAHASQVAMDGPFFALAEALGADAMGYEHFRLAKGSPAPPTPAGYEGDLFAGLGLDPGPGAASG